MTQNTTRNNAGALVPLRTAGADGLAWWVEQYFQHAVTTSPASQQVQRHDLGLLLRYLRAEEGTDQCMAWTPRLARAFQEHLQQTLTPVGRRAWSDRTISEARRPPRWLVDSALACSPARVPGSHRCARGRGAASRPLL